MSLVGTTLRQIGFSVLALGDRLATPQAPAPTPIADRPIPLQRIDSAAQRLDDMRHLNDGDFPGADAHTKHRLFQEFFFHLVGSAEFLASYVNAERALGIADDDVNINSVAAALGPDPLASALLALYVNVRKLPMPPATRPREHYLYRAYVYRHLVTHRRPNPFRFTIPERETFLIVDPRTKLAPPRVALAAPDPIFHELDTMLSLFRKGVEDALALV